jgi:putative FmdB family regulatory protein
MPIYEYKCKKCGNHSEHIQKFSDSPLTDCNDCGTTGSLEKLMSLGSFHLKGSGWYLTDYAKKNTPSTSSEAPGKTETKTETKTPEKTSGDAPKDKA